MNYLPISQIDKLITESDLSFCPTKLSVIYLVQSELDHGHLISPRTQGH